MYKIHNCTVQTPYLGFYVLCNYMRARWISDIDEEDDVENISISFSASSAFTKDRNIYCEKKVKDKIEESPDSPCKISSDRLS